MQEANKSRLSRGALGLVPPLGRVFPHHWQARVSDTPSLPNTTSIFALDYLPGYSMLSATDVRLQLVTTAISYPSYN